MLDSTCKKRAAWANIRMQTAVAEKASEPSGELSLGLTGQLP